MSHTQHMLKCTTEFGHSLSPRRHKEPPTQSSRPLLLCSRAWWWAAAPSAGGCRDQRPAETAGCSCPRPWAHTAWAPTWKSWWVCCVGGMQSNKFSIVISRVAKNFYTIVQHCLICRIPATKDFWPYSYRTRVTAFGMLLAAYRIDISAIPW